MSAALIEAARAALGALQMTAVLKSCGGMLPGVRELIMSAVEDAEAAIPALREALAAAEAQPTSCQHKRQKWAINMQSGSCSDCGAKFVFGRDGSPDVWSAPPAQPVGEPVAWRIKERINGEFDSEWNILSFEPPTTPRTIAIEALYTAQPAQPAATAEPIPTGEASDSDFGAFEDAAR